MANASTKRIAASNEQALRNLQLGLLIVNVSLPFTFSHSVTDRIGWNMGDAILDIFNQ